MLCGLPLNERVIQIISNILLNYFFDEDTFKLQTQNRILASHFHQQVTMLLLYLKVSPICFRALRAVENTYLNSTCLFLLFCVFIDKNYLPTPTPVNN